jgi:outer membrane protein assembly factor BamE (lipoprotein component of BamABCDE complex)
MNKTIHAARAGAAVLLAITLSACATRMGRDFNDDYAREIKPGETTKAEIRSRLGRPVYVSRGSEEDVWTYAYYKGGGVGVEIRNWFGRPDPINPFGGQQKSLVVTFKGDTVKEATFKQELPRPDPLEEAYR